MLLPPPRGLNKVRLLSPLKILVLPVRFIAGHITDRLIGFQLRVTSRKDNPTSRGYKGGVPHLKANVQCLIVTATFEYIRLVTPQN